LHRLVIFSDLDGTLLDEKYRWTLAKEAIDLCKELDIPIALVSSKTKAEIEVIRERLGLNDPFAVENGGAVFFPKGKGYEKIEIGVSYSELVEALRKIKKELGWNIKGFSDMDINEIAYITGMDLSSAYLASLREYDEPFIILDKIDDLSPLYELADKMGLRVIKGGRFFHLQGKNDKGKALDIMIPWFRKKIGRDIITVALGDSPNDFPMFLKVDIPVLIASSRRISFPKLPNLRISRKKGPEGWNQEVIKIIREIYKGG